MTNRKAIIVFTLAAVFLLSALSLTGCGTGAGTAKDAVIAATEKAGQAESMTYDMTLEAELDISGTQQSMLITGSAQMIKEPQIVYTEMRMEDEPGGAEGFLTKTYLRQEDENFAIYTWAGTDSGSLGWTKTIVDASYANQYNAEQSMKIYADAAENFKQTGTEQVNNIDSARYEGYIPAESVNEVMKESGMLDQFSKMGLGENVSDALLNVSADIPVTIWIGTEKEEIVQYCIDMTDYIQQYVMALTQSTSTGATGSEEVPFRFTKMEEIITVTGYNNVSSINIPEDALNAEEQNLE